MAWMKMVKMSTTFVKQYSTAWHSITCRGRGRERENQCPIVCRLGNPTVSAFSCIILQTQTHTHWFKCIHSALLSAPYIIIFQYFLPITFLAQSILFRDSLLFLLGENLLNRKCIHYPISNARWENDRRENLCWFFVDVVLLWRSHPKIVMLKKRKESRMLLIIFWIEKDKCLCVRKYFWKTIFSPLSQGNSV